MTQAADETGDEERITLTQAGYDATLGSETTLTRLRAPRPGAEIEAWQMLLLREVRRVAEARNVEPRSVALECVRLLNVDYTIVPVLGDVS